MLTTARLVALAPYTHRRDVLGRNMEDLRWIGGETMSTDIDVAVRIERVREAAANLVTAVDALERAADSMSAEPEVSPSKSSEGEERGSYVTEKEVSKYLSIPIRTLQYWRTTPGHGPAWYKIGRAVRYKVSDLDAYTASLRRS